MRSVLRSVVLLFVLSANVLAGCTTMPEPAVEQASTMTVQATPRATKVVSQTPTIELFIPSEVATMITVPDGDPRVASVRELLFRRLDLEGEGAALRPTEPVIPLEEFGAVEVWAFELPDPYVHFAFYLYENESSFDDQVDDVPWAEGSQLRGQLPEGVAVLGGYSSGNFAVAFYYPDGSHGDPDAAEDAMYEILHRTAGDE